VKRKKQRKAMKRAAKRRMKERREKPGPKGLRLVIEGDWRDAMRASLVIGGSVAGTAKK
jgi:hypothetical protein